MPEARRDGVDEGIPTRTHFGWFIGLAVATAIFHLAFGLYYVIKAGNFDEKLSLRTSGEEYLASFAGWNTDYEHDCPGYNRAALSVLTTGVPRSKSGVLFFRAGVYAYFLAACYAVGGVRLLPVAVTQAVLSGLICLLAGLTAARITSRRKKAAMFLAGALWLINLRVAMYVGYIYPTMLVLFFTAVALYAATGPLTAPRVAAITAAAGLGTYAQGAFFVVTFATGTWLLIQYVRERHRPALAGGLMLFALVAGKFLLNWSSLAGSQIDSWRSYDRGGTLWLANNPCYESMTLWSLWEERPANPRTTWRASVQEKSRFDEYRARAGGDLGKAARLWILENPGQYAKLVLIRLRTELGPFTGQMSVRNRAVSTVIWLLVFPAGVYGLWQTRSSPAGQFGLLVVGFVVAFGSLFIVEWYLRYRIPAEMVLLVFAGCAYASRCRLWRIRSR
jgi:hypothetical protein